MKAIQFQCQNTTPESGFDTWVVPVFKQDDGTLLRRYGLETLVNELIEAGDFRPEQGKVRLLLQPAGPACERLVLVGMGDAAKLSVKRYLDTLDTTARTLDDCGARRVFSALPLAVPRGLDAPLALYHNVLRLQRSFYDYCHESRGEHTPREPVLEQVTFPLEETASHQAMIEEAQATAFGMALTQDLANMPPNICTPTYLAETARRLGETYGFTVTVFDREQLEEMGMGAFMAVARGAETPPKLIVLEYRGGVEDEAPTALVGKGVTFDTGGISLKPGAAMDEMKFDMAGAAAVLGTFEALGRLKPACNVVGVIPATENMPSGRATRPGDVVRSLSGQTIEILNTDAEGRLILCDALTYAQRTYNPARIVDIATLTGACIIALGHHISGLMSNDDALAQSLTTAGERTYDRLWRLPLSEEYDQQLKSNFADMANIGGRPAGTITAGQFLARFIEDDRPWAHLDIAGTAWVSGEKKGATGRPVPTLVHWLLHGQRDA